MIDTKSTPDDWRTASYTNNNGACVKVHRSLDALRDSKEQDGPVLPGNVLGLVAAIKAGAIGR